MNIKITTNTTMRYIYTVSWSSMSFYCPQQENTRKCFHYLAAHQVLSNTFRKPFTVKSVCLHYLNAITNIWLIHFNIYLSCLMLNNISKLEIISILHLTKLLRPGSDHCQIPEFKIQYLQYYNYCVSVSITVLPLTR